MFNENPEPAEEFPSHKEAIHQLKMRDTHFARLHDEYHEVLREITRIEQEIDTVSDTVTENLKKKRLSLKDELLAIIQKAA